MYPDVWGQGALFCYSGLDGENTLENGVPGTLCADKLGITLHSLGRVELYLALSGVADIRYEIVGGDIILADIEPCSGEPCRCGILFSRQDVVKGRGAPYAKPMLSGYLLPVEYCEGFAYVSDNKSGAHCALFAFEKGGYIDFALAFSRISLDDAKEKARAAACVSFETETETKLSFYRALPIPANLEKDVEKALYKSFSLMKTQVYTSEGRFRGIWTTPDRLPHRKCWLWDSVFHALGNRHISIKLACDTIHSIFEFQREDGFISHMAGPAESSPITQPPVIAWGAYELYKSGADARFLKENYERLKAYLKWNMENRDENHNMLFEWITNEGDPANPCDECGMDNSPRFDAYETMDCIDFSCYMASEARAMEQIARSIDMPDEALAWAALYKRMVDAINERLWDEESGFYYDRIEKNGELKKVKSVASFLALFAGICDGRRARIMVEKLTDPDLFWSPFPVPTISRDDPCYGTDMWRGPVWINFNYFILKGLSDYGYRELHDALLSKTIDTIARWYMHEGVIFEFFDSECRVNPKKLNRKGRPVEPYDFYVRMQTIRDYGWTGTLYADMVMESRGIL
jgi:hypothetical protein